MKKALVYTGRFMGCVGFELMFIGGLGGIRTWMLTGLFLMVAWYFIEPNSRN